MRQDTTAVQIQAGTITYEPGPYPGEKLRLELHLSQPQPREHLILAASELRPDAAYAIPDSVDAVATRHLRAATTADHAYISSDGRVTSNIYLPVPQSERPPMFGTPQAYLPAATSHLLSDFQKEKLPELRSAISDVVRPELQPHIEDIAILAAAQLISRADLLRAYQRTSVSEVLTDYEDPRSPATFTPEQLAAIKTTSLSFPQHATEALRTVTHAAAQSGAPASPAHRTPQSSTANQTHTKGTRTHGFHQHRRNQKPGPSPAQFAHQISRRTRPGTPTRDRPQRPARQRRTR